MLHICVQHVDDGVDDEPVCRDGHGGSGDARNRILRRDVTRDDLGPYVRVGEQRQPLAVRHEDGRDAVRGHQLGGMADRGERLARLERTCEEVGHAQSRELRQTVHDVAGARQPLP